MKTIPSSLPRQKDWNFRGLRVVFLLFSLPQWVSTPVMAEPELKKAGKGSGSGEEIEVEVTRKEWVKNSKGEAATDGESGKKDRVKLSYVTYNHDKSLFVGYYQDDWFEIVSLHDAKTKAQLGSVYCQGGVPETFRFSKDNQFLGAEASVGWYVWKIPGFEEIFILGDMDFDAPPPPEPKKDAQPVLKPEGSSR